MARQIWETFRVTNFVSRGELRFYYTASKGFHGLDEIFCRRPCRGGNIFVLKPASIVLALLSLMMLPTAMSAQLIPHGNVYLGASYSSSDIVTANRQGLKG